MGTLADLVTRTERDEESGCLRWTGAHTSQGYGQITVDGRKVGAHRAAYEAAHGPIPEGLEVDHVYERGCRYRDCVEPDHLEAVTHAENLRRKNALITSCPRGHKYTPENTELWGAHRVCRECRRRPVSCSTCGAETQARHAARHRRSNCV